MVGQICPAPPHYCRAPRDRHLYKDKYPKFAVLSKEKKILMQNPSGGQCKKGLSKPRPRRRDPEAKMQQISFLWNICFHSWSQNWECDLSIFLRYRAFKVLLSCRLLTVFKICIIQNTFGGDEFLSSILRPSYQQNICKEFGFLTCL